MQSESYRFYLHIIGKRVKSSTDGCFQAFLTPKTELWASSIFSWNVFEVIRVHLCWIQWSVGTQQPVKGLTADDKTSLLSSKFSGIQAKEPGLSGDEKNLNNFEKSFNKRHDRGPNGHSGCAERAKFHKVDHQWSQLIQIKSLLLQQKQLKETQFSVLTKPRCNLWCLNILIWGHTAVAPIE